MNRLSYANTRVSVGKAYNATLRAAYPISFHFLGEKATAPFIYVASVLGYLTEARKALKVGKEDRELALDHLSSARNAFAWYAEEIRDVDYLSSLVWDIEDNVVSAMKQLGYTIY